MMGRPWKRAAEAVKLGGMKKKMGTFYTECAVASHFDRGNETIIKKLLVDTGSENTWIDAGTLRRIGITEEEETLSFLTADGRTLERKVGYAVIRVGKRQTTDALVFAQPGDMQILGARSLEGLSLAVDPARKRLVFAGPLPAAFAC